jgi:hypothetical protein
VTVSVVDLNRVANFVTSRRSAKAKGGGKGKGEGVTTLNVERQDAANVVWTARAAEVGRTGS